MGLGAGATKEHGQDTSCPGAASHGRTSPQHLVHCVLENRSQVVISGSFSGCSWFFRRVWKGPGAEGSQALTLRGSCPAPEQQSGDHTGSAAAGPGLEGGLESEGSPGSEGSQVRGGPWGGAGAGGWVGVRGGPGVGGQPGQGGARGRGGPRSEGGLWVRGVSGSEAGARAWEELWVGGGPGQETPILKFPSGWHRGSGLESSHQGDLPEKGQPGVCAGRWVQGQPGRPWQLRHRAGQPPERPGTAGGNLNREGPACWAWKNIFKHFSALKEKKSKGPSSVGGAGAGLAHAGRASGRRLAEV